MKKRAGLFIVLMILLLLTFTTALASEGMGNPVGGCPPGFHLHSMSDMDHDGDHMHHHIGNDQDQNGDGYLCVKHAGVGVDYWNHVHRDNTLPLR